MVHRAGPCWIYSCWRESGRHEAVLHWKDKSGKEKQTNQRMAREINLTSLRKIAKLDVSFQEYIDELFW